MGNIRKENKDLKEKCVSYEAKQEDLKRKVMDDSEKLDQVYSDWLQHGGLRGKQDW